MDERNVVILFGKPIPDQFLTVYRERRLTPQNSLEPYKTFAKAAIFYFNPEKPGQFKDYLSEIAQELSDLGAEHLYLVDDQTTFAQIVQILKSARDVAERERRPIPSYLEVTPTVLSNSPDAAERIARIPRRPILRTTQTNFRGVAVSDDVKRFLRRAFNDCGNLTLFSLTAVSPPLCFAYMLFFDAGSRPYLSLSA